jgi:hypothetical protein
MNKHLRMVLNRFQSEGYDCDYATEHGNDETYFIIFHSWDDKEAFIETCKDYISEPNAPDYEIEREFDCELVFDDEYTLCSDCYHIIRTSPTHYGWQPEFYKGDGFIVCKECFNHNGYAEDYVEERINNPKNAINSMVTEEQLTVLGFKKANDDSYESGHHYGQTDDPETIYEALREKYDEVIFIIDSVGQFDTHFSAWVRNEMDVVGR